MSDGFFNYPGQIVTDNAQEKLFTRFQDGDWEKLIKFAALRSFADGSVIFEGVQAEIAAYLLMSGSVLLAEQSQSSLLTNTRRLEPGSAFGLLSFFDKRANVMRATAVGIVETLVLTDAMLERLTVWEPRVAMIVVRDLANVVAGILRHHAKLV